MPGRAVVVAILGVVGWLVVATVQGGWALLIVGIVMVVALLFVGASIPSLLLTHFAFFRHGAAPSQGAPQPDSASEAFQALGIQTPE